MTPSTKHLQRWIRWWYQRQSAGFSLLGGWGESLTSRKFAHFLIHTKNNSHSRPPSPHQMFIPPTKYQTSYYLHTQVWFWFYSMFSLYRMLFLALKKFQMVKITPPQVPNIWWKNPPMQNSRPPTIVGGIFLLLPLNAILKILISPQSFLYLLILLIIRSLFSLGS